MLLPRSRSCNGRHDSKLPAILLIDEVDSFLQDRRNAERSWELSGVNEMLTQMESYQGIFIASTNLMSSVDSAALRRFDLKVSFDYLNGEQAWQLLESYGQSLSLGHLDSQLKGRIQNLRPLPKLPLLCVAILLKMPR